MPKPYLNMVSRPSLTRDYIPSPFQQVWVVQSIFGNKCVSIEPNIEDKFSSPHLLLEMYSWVVSCDFKIFHVIKNEGIAIPNIYLS